MISQQRKNSAAPVCKSDLFGRILNYDHKGRSYRVLPFRRTIGVRRVSVLSEMTVGESAI